ncbi:MAG: hypothetical protein QXF23_00835 [Candidatus Bathyarchaeia archaeon]|nr:hypothetical protein [Candidatus Bathyarchaeota archaeon]
MEGKARSGERKAYHATKIRKAAQLLFYKRHSIPGARGWELKKKIGSDYLKVINLLNEYLAKIGLTIKTVFEEETNPPENPSNEQYDKARFYITLKDEVNVEDAKMMGWRIDDLAALCASIAFIISRGGKAPRKELEDLLRAKIPEWRVETSINKFVRMGYLIEDEDEMIYIGWRTRAEVDQKKLLDLLLEAEGK